MTKKPRIDGLAPADGRSAGILLHLTSLPSAFSCGDLGPEAYHFADFLAASGQRYWQLLPLNPVEKGTGFSPYSALSAMAGNALLISPEKMADDGLIERSVLEPLRTTAGNTADFDTAASIREQLLDRAYRSFRKKKPRGTTRAFAEFQRAHRRWLDDFSLYLAAREKEGAAWYEWPAGMRNREARTMSAFRREHASLIDRCQWVQFVFHEQYKSLRRYCNAKGIRLFGDLPIYVSHDSADVWAHRTLFSVAANGQPRFVAGVPPDYFNSDGQLWGMPVFNWNSHKRTNYAWWLDRLRSNMTNFDVIRLDHFRAFADYWAVPASETTARNGKWMPGPDKDFFQAVQKKFKRLPFVAEDLGDINDKVLRLRDAFGLPGMKVLQFAFGDNMGTSDYIPHNYGANFIVYTGTHDNNTTSGWFRRDAGPVEKANLRRYLGRDVSGKNVARLLIRLAYQSVARTAIIPLQDVLGLDEKARMNAPASVAGNWTWRMEKGALTADVSEWLNAACVLSNRQRS